MAIWWRKAAVKFITSDNGVVTVVPLSTPEQEHDVKVREAGLERVREKATLVAIEELKRRVKTDDNPGIESDEEIELRYLQSFVERKHNRRLHNHKRRTRLECLPYDFSGEQWERCLDYFNHTCAVCSYPLNDIFGTAEPHADHWIPVTYKGADNPGTVVGNMICLCSKCNLSKNDILPQRWLKLRYDDKKASTIIRRIEAYFEWAKQQ